MIVQPPGCFVFAPDPLVLQGAKTFVKYRDDEHQGDPAKGDDAEKDAELTKIDEKYYFNRTDGFAGGQIKVVIAESLESGSGVGDQVMPRVFSLYQNVPNPFNPTTSIRYELPRDSYVELVIYNVQGQVVRELVSGWQKAQRYVVAWDGKNAQGSSVASGLYFYRLDAGAFHQTRKMILLR